MSFDEGRKRGDGNVRWDAADVKSVASGRWTIILPSLAGIDAAVLDEKKHPCAKCGGTDRFRCRDADTGALFCNQCFNTKNGDGFAAIQWLTGWTFPEALQAVAESLNLPGSRNGHVTNGKPLRSRRRSPHRTARRSPPTRPRGSHSRRERLRWRRSVA